MDDPNLSEDQNSTEGYLTQLVGEGKKYKDEEGLAKAYTHADSFIQHLERQTDELRTELEKRMALETFIKNQEEAKPNTDDLSVDPALGNSSGDTKPDLDESQSPPVIDQSELIKRIKAELSADETQKLAETNIEKVETRLLSVYGEEGKVNEAINAKAAEMGVSVGWLRDIASKSPNGFFNLLGLKEERSANPPESVVNSAGLKPAEEVSNKPLPGTKAYFDEIRRSSMSKYLSREVQLALHKAAAENPEEFGLSKT